MDQPTVAAVMLVNGRDAMVERAVACYRSQTYQRKRLVVLNSNPGPASALPAAGDLQSIVIDAPSLAGWSIGALRNHLNSFIGHSADLIIHFDSDDWSGPDRIAEQVDLWQSVDQPVVGYNSATFWDERCRGCKDGLPIFECDGYNFTPGAAGKVLAHGTGLGPMMCTAGAWLYSNAREDYALIGSMCYSREFWERNPFDEKADGRNTSEAQHWFGKRNVLGVFGRDFIARIHEGNTSQAYRHEMMLASEAQGGEWLRMPYADDACRERMAL